MSVLTPIVKSPAIQHKTYSILLSLFFYTDTEGAHGIYGPKDSDDEPERCGRAFVTHRSHRLTVVEKSYHALDDEVGEPLRDFYRLDIAPVRHAARHLRMR